MDRNPFSNNLMTLGIFSYIVGIELWKIFLIAMYFSRIYREVTGKYFIYFSELFLVMSGD